MFSEYYLKHVFVILLLISHSYSADQYGPYNIEWKECKLCSEPNKDFLVSTMMMKPVPNAKSADKPSSTMFHFNLTVTTPIPLDKLKIETYKIHDSGKKVMIMRKMLVQPCQSSYVKFVDSLQIFKFKDNSKNCIMIKSSYTIDLNFDEITRTVIGNEFYYGEYFVRSTVISNGKVIACLMISSVFRNIKDNKINKN